MYKKSTGIIVCTGDIMKKRFIIGMVLIILIFLVFVLMREFANKHMLKKEHNIKNYNFVEKLY